VNDLVVMLTALDLEYRAVRETLSGLRLHRHQAGTRFEVGRVKSGRCRVALALVGKGNHPTAVLAERAIAAFDPAAVLFVGVAGALWPKVGLGTVVVATHIYAYHGATSEDDGAKARPRAWEISHRADQIARQLARSQAWAKNLPPGATVPQVRFGPIAAGEIVQDSAISANARWVREHYHDALAIEMEAAGVAQAGHLNDSRPVIVVRGISDPADGSKAAADRAGWQPRAAASAAAFATALAEELILEQTEEQPVTTSTTAGTRDMGSGITNIASGNARIGVQAGQIFGSVHVAPEPAAPRSVPSQIADFRIRLREARQAGTLDEDTYQAAEAELETAVGSLAAGAEPGTGRLMVALKRLRGLVADTAELAANVAVIIAAVKGMS
jgi:8-oxo-dGTP diphosphatase